jgi:hypothetical protein
MGRHHLAEEYFESRYQQHSSANNLNKEPVFNSNIFAFLFI